MSRRWARGSVVLGVVAAGWLAASCSSDGPSRRGSGAAAAARPDGTPPPAVALESSAAAERIAQLRARFQLSVAAPGRATTSTAPAMRPAAAEGLVVSAGALAAVLSPGAREAARRPATVALPLRADGEVRVLDDRSGLSVAFSLTGASAARVALAGGYALYPGALDGADVVHRVDAEGTEDYVIFEGRPSREELSYSVDVRRVAGLRLVANTLEFLDRGGVPRLRVAPPFLVDDASRRRAATIHVDGCALDVDPRGPSRRAVTPPGASRCTVRLSWKADRYPLLVDPAWVATGSMSVARSYHTAVSLPSGEVLVAGGSNDRSAELYDPTSGTFAATGEMAAVRLSFAATLLPSGAVLLEGGTDATHALQASAELYDPSKGTFAPTGSMSDARAYHTATLLETGMTLIVGGQGEFGCLPLGDCALMTVELYDPSRGTFTYTGDLATPRVQHAATLLDDGRVLVSGGAIDSKLTSTATAELYSASTGRFTSTATPMTISRYGHSATTLASGEVLVAGGISNLVAFGLGLVTLASAEIFDPVTGSFAAAPLPMSRARRSHSATLLLSGDVLLAGGDVDELAPGEVSTADLYDPSSSLAFAPTGAMSSARASQAAARLDTGQVLVTGGVATADTWLATAEVYALGPGGAACASDADCAMGVCDVAGVCCAATTACGGTCMGCAPGTGACVEVVRAPDPGTCDGAMTCDADGACKRANGQPSTDPAVCASGFASDGLCCDAACSGACDVCSSALEATADGVCTAASAGYEGDAPCGDGFACNGRATSCPGPACGGDTDCLPADYCDADGACRLRRSTLSPCDTAAGVDCRVAGCRECADGFCVGGTCCATATQCVATGACTSDGLGLVPPGGDPEEPVSCAPYVCRTGACQTRCASVGECSAPAVCDDTGACVPPPTNQGEVGSACALTPVRGGPRSALAWLGLAAALALRRVRRRGAAASAEVGLQGTRGLG